MLWGFPYHTDKIRLCIWFTPDYSCSYYCHMLIVHFKIFGLQSSKKKQIRFWTTSPDNFWITILREYRYLDYESRLICEYAKKLEILWVAK